MKTSAKNRGRFRIRIPKAVLPLASEAIQKFRPLWHRLWNPFGSPKPWNFVAMWDLAMFDWSGLHTTLSANDPNPDRNRFKSFKSAILFEDLFLDLSYGIQFGCTLTSVSLEKRGVETTNTFLKVAPIYGYIHPGAVEVLYMFSCFLVCPFSFFFLHHLADDFNSYMMFLLWWLLQNLTKSRLWIAKSLSCLLFAALPPPSQALGSRNAVGCCQTQDEVHRVLASSGLCFCEFGLKRCAALRCMTKNILV